MPKIELQIKPKNKELEVKFAGKRNFCTFAPP